MSHAIEVNALEVSFGDVRAVNGVTLHVDYGETFALLGPNGAGKTTLVETLMGFRRPLKGSVRLHGLDPLENHREITLRTGALLQRGGVWFPMTPLDVIGLTGTYYDAPRAVGELVELLNLTACQRTPWRRLSGGEQQRTLLALALIGRPKVLVLDEPTTAVDPEGRQVIRQIIETERDRGCAVLITTHELIEAERMALRVAIMHQGQLVVVGSLSELAGEPELDVELSSPLDPTIVASALGGEVIVVSPTRLRCRVAPTPDNQALLNQCLLDHGVSVVSLRTRASLEERYLELVGRERGKS